MSVIYDLIAKRHRPPEGMPSLPDWVLFYDEDQEKVINADFFCIAAGCDGAADQSGYDLITILIIEFSLFLFTI